MRNWFGDRGYPVGTRYSVPLDFSSQTLIFRPVERRPGATPVQVKPQAREAKVLPCCLKVRTDCRKASWRVSHPGSGLQDIGHGFPGFMAYGHGVGGSFGRNPPSPPFKGSEVEYYRTRGGYSRYSRTSLTSDPSTAYSRVSQALAPQKK